MRKIIINLQNSNARKIQFTIAINFSSLEDAEEEHVMHSSSGNIKFTPYSDANNEFDKPFNSLPSRYQENLEISMKRSNLIFESVQLMYCKCHKVTFIRSGSWIGSRRKKWFKNTDDKCFHYTATVLLNYEEIESHSERVSNIKPLINIIGKE